MRLFALVFDKINPDSVHSVSLGVFRLPDKYFKNLMLYPDEKTAEQHFAVETGDDVL